jgi:hypothetical protein
MSKELILVLFALCIGICIGFCFMSYIEMMRIARETRERMGAINNILIDTVSQYQKINHCKRIDPCLRR